MFNLSPHAQSFNSPKMGKNSPKVVNSLSGRNSPSFDSRVSPSTGSNSPKVGNSSPKVGNSSPLTGSNSYILPPPPGLLHAYDSLKKEKIAFNMANGDIISTSTGVYIDISVITSSNNNCAEIDFSKMINLSCTKNLINYDPFLPYSFENLFDLINYETEVQLIQKGYKFNEYGLFKICPQTGHFREQIMEKVSLTIIIINKITKKITTVHIGKLMVYLVKNTAIETVVKNTAIETTYTISPEVASTDAIALSNVSQMTQSHTPWAEYERLCNIPLSIRFDSNIAITRPRLITDPRGCYCHEDADQTTPLTQLYSLCGRYNSKITRAFSFGNPFLEKNRIIISKPDINEFEYQSGDILIISPNLWQLFQRQDFIQLFKIHDFNVILDIIREKEIDIEDQINKKKGETLRKDKKTTTVLIHC